MRPVKLHWLFLAVLLPGIVALVVLLVDSYRREEANLQQNALQTARALRQVVEEQIIGKQKVLQGFAMGSGAFDRRDDAALRRQAVQLLTETDFADALVVTDPSGQQYLNTLIPEGLPLPTTKNMARVRRVFETRGPYISDVVIGTVARRQLITIDVPVIRNGAVLFDLNLVLFPERLGRILNTQQLPEGWVASIYDATGHIAARSRNGAAVVGQPVPAVLMARLRGPAEGSVKGVSQEGEEVFGAYSRSDVTGYSVAVAVPVAILQRELTRNLALSALIVAAMTVASLLLARRFGGQLQAALHGLVAAVDSAAAGRSGVIVLREGPAEVRHLSAQFELMLQARNEADSAIRTERQRLYDILETLPALVVLRTPDFRVVFANAIYRQRFGEGHGDNCADLFSSHAARHAGKGGGEWEWVGPDGRIYAIHDSPIVGPDGAPLVLKMGIDITARRAAEAALRDREESLRIALTFSPNVIVMATQQARFIFANRQAELCFGYSQPEWLSMDVADLFPPSEVEQVMTHFRRNVAGSHEFFEVLARHKSGRLVDVEINGVLLPDGRVLGEIIDISARKAAEKQIRQLSMAVEQSIESVVITDLETRIEYVNEAFVRSSGYRRDEVLGQTPALLKSGQTPRSTYDGLWTALHDGQPWRGEFINRRKNGEAYVENTIIVPIRERDGQITHYLAIKEDVTEKRRIEGELERYRYHLESVVEERTAALSVAKEAAEAANRAKSTFLTTMSHELRTPMNAIMGMTAMALRRATDPRQIEQLNKARQATQHLLALINDILDISRIEADRLSLDQLDFRLDSVLDNLRTLMEGSVEQKGLRLLIDVTPGLAEMALRGDPLRLGQILVNLVGNALKFTPAGQIEVRVRQDSDTAGDVLLRFEVRDSGIGIAAEDQQRLFATFEQVDGSMTRKYGGSGLGLAISRRLARMMGGDMGVASEIDVGSTFWFTARLQKGDERAVRPRSRADAELSLRERFPGVRLLLAEDDRVNQEVVKALIEEAGIAVDVAGDGAEALAMAQQTPYALILMDMQMPVLNGIEATRRIRQLAGYADTPIVALTANAFEDDRRACLAAGMDDFITKPVEPARLLESLLQWLEPAAAGRKSADS
ncbi:PAS domain S-box protein [Zoogloea sp. LCSB751]|uniref:PAS domain S-box protein n=1 Tax=Zoogloea sp. LCSB751 TaxID=1965277 RepID=UPI0009A53DDF|nr:PAS domain S-box protein [Zoogloea sp. LCSB751]